MERHCIKSTEYRDGARVHLTYCCKEVRSYGPSEPGEGLARGEKCEKCIENKAKAKAKEGNNA